MAFDAYGLLKPRRSRAEQGAAKGCPSSGGAVSEDLLALSLFPAARNVDPWIGRFEAAYVGHAEEGDFRAAGSSGGLASWTAVELLRAGVVDAVAHVAPSDGDARFDYQISRSVSEVRHGSKSRYYPVELSGVLREMRARPGRYALLGVPCFIKAAELLRRDEPVLRERLVCTLGLFCGHMKSARMVDSFALQMGVRPAEVVRADFRVKDPSAPANWYVAGLRLRSGEERRLAWWDMADGDWGAGFFQNAACNFCDDVTAELADASFGDAWLEPYASDGRGTNVVVVRNPMMRELFERARLEGRVRLEPVDADFVRRTQAAGFRQRREGLAFRLAHRRRSKPEKRVAAGIALSPRRAMIYRMRAGIAAWSHRVFLLASLTRRPALYLGWARLVLTLYQGLAYSRGPVGRVIDRLERLAGKDRP